MMVSIPLRPGKGIVLTRQHGLFAVMTLIWGLTWVAVRTGIDALPPLFFAAARLLTAGAVVGTLTGLGIVGRGAARPRVGGQWRRLVLASLLIDTACYGFLFWGMKSVPTGIAAVLDLSLIPVGLFVLGIASGDETYSTRRLTGVLLGICGLALLFLPELARQHGLPAAQRTTLAGMAAIVASTVAFCCGTILSRPLLQRIDALSLSGLHHLVGGGGLLLVALVCEPLDGRVLARLLEPRLLGSCLFLALGGSVAAFTIYLTLLRDWGPARAGLYAFVSPVVALVVGAAFLGETVGVAEAAGSLVLLFAASLAMPRNPAKARPPWPIEGRPAVSLFPSPTNDQGELAS